ncbi:MAG: hypothetical protein V1844_13130 [Pseudomonadota bacterium]
MNLDERPLSWAAFPNYFFRVITGDAHMKNDLFPSLNFNHLQSWAKEFVELCYPDAGIDQITLRKFNLWNKGNPELAKVLRSEFVTDLETRYLITVHLSEKCEFPDKRKALIGAVHCHTIYYNKYYIEIGIDKGFLHCLKERTSTDFFKEMNRFAFWCYGAQQGEYAPDINGYDWPLHADREGDYWLLYPIAKNQLHERRFDSEAIFNGEAYVQLEDLHLDEAAQQRIRVLHQAGKLFVYENDPDRTIVNDDELHEYGLRGDSDGVVGVHAHDINSIAGFMEVRPHEDFSRPVENQTGCKLERDPDGLVYKLENNFIPVPAEMVDFQVHYAKLSDIIRLGLLSEPAPPQPEPVKSYADYLSDGSGMKDTTSMFPFHIAVINNQIERWRKEFKFELSGAFLCKMNLQRGFKAAGIQLYYCIVLLSQQEFPASFMDIKSQVSPVVSLLDDDFILAYTQEPERTWRGEWCIEPASPADEVPSPVEFKYRVSLLDEPGTGSMSNERGMHTVRLQGQSEAIQDVKVPAEEFVKSLHDAIKESIKDAALFLGKRIAESKPAQKAEIDIVPLLPGEPIKAEMEAGRVDKMPGAVKTETVKAAPQTKAEQMAAAEAFVKSLREDANGIWKAVNLFRNPTQITKAVEAADAYIKEHPATKFKAGNLTTDILKYDNDKPRRAIFRAVQSVLSDCAQYKLSLSKIESILSHKNTD